MAKRINHYEGILVDRNIEIFELEEKIKRLNLENNELKKYQGMYFQKLREYTRLKNILKKNLESIPDYLKYELKDVLEELFGIKYN